MAIADDISVATNGNIRWTGGAATYTVLDLHRFLELLAWEAAASGDDLLDITSATPSERSTDNIISLLGTYNIDDTVAEHLYDGSISQDSGNVLYSGLVVVGAVNSTTTLQVVQNNALYDGDSPFWGTGLNADAAANILMQCLIKTRTGGADIDGKRIRVTAREFGDTYAEFSVTMGLGNSVAAIFTSADLNNTTAAGTVATWVTITNVEGYQTIDLDNGAGARPYYSQWNRDIYAINQLYERTKWLTRRSTTSTVYGMDGELFRGITHQWAYASEVGGPFTQNEVLSWGAGATAGTGALLALYDAGVTGTQWIQLLTGIAPINGMTITGASSHATCVVNGAPTARTLSNAAFIGTSTGSAIIGSFGLGIETADLTYNDKIFDLTNAQQVPPNWVTYTVASIIAGDYVLVGPESGSTFELDQLELDTTLSGAAEVAVVVTTAIPVDTPVTGTIRVQLDTGIYRRVAYTSWASDTFTIAPTDFTGANAATAGNNVMITYLDVAAVGTSVSFTAKYVSDRSLYNRVRNGGGSAHQDL
jgi:hypothetical protein